MDTPVCPALNGLAACDDRLERLPFYSFSTPLVHIYSKSCLLFMIFKTIPPYKLFMIFLTPFPSLPNGSLLPPISPISKKAPPFGPLRAYLPATTMPMKHAQIRLL
ncbi:hypothetical protein TNIN_171631 [Trichonephila inaurata madagascariensis]|uniref:Uncharacterized protein n=1 Tax=Trichonephila inaurata madagascariensis TaxID=2747483 RepID=A0A8X6IM46_9ARAC|nr:hypothetical protein TNIN_171631 [Trichonephila inaurata madagascariensis]